MSIDVPAVQAALTAAGLDGWLLYDFHGSNPVSRRVAGLSSTGHMTTRRWFYLVPAQGSPRALVHKIERRTLAHLPGTTREYAGRLELEAGRRDILAGCGRVAMEYSPRAAIPYVSRVDAGTIELVRACGAEVASSGDLVQQFEAMWPPGGFDTHRAASERLYRIKDRAFAFIAARLRDGVATTEYDVQSAMVAWFTEEGLVSDSAPIVAAQENAGDPHYQPGATTARTIGRNEVVLLDLWGRLDQPRAVYADISWMGFTGPAIPAPVEAAFTAVRDARDAAVALVQEAAAAGREVRGFEADAAARQVLQRAGFGEAILHRTGHSLGEEVHGNGAHLDDYETKDERRLLPGTGFTVEPGLYFPAFGVRTEINVAWGPGGPEVTGPRQMAVVPLV
ncbi:MAG: M24 family metallopeptidase [Vicinamibacterales bacterium]